MASVSFFTEESAITAIQTSEQAYGPLTDSGNLENYNLDSNFTVSTSAPAYAVAKSLLVAIQSSTDTNLLNLILLPLNNITAGIPIKFFVYRGIRKSSLINSNDSIPIADSTWKDDNILKIIKKLQDKKNIEEGTPGVVATKESLGYQYSSLSDNTYLEKIFFANDDEFQPLIVGAGCEIGKFAGGTTSAGISVLMELMGKDPVLNIAKSGANIFSIEKVNLNNPALTDKERMELSFQNRFEKEVILGYMDITAFYGTCRNQSIKVSGLSDTNPLENFYNRDVVYIDIRDDYGFSFNHFFKFKDEIQYAVLPSGDSGEPTNFTTIDYYQDWPIVQLRGVQYNTAKDYLWLELPLNKLKRNAPFYLSSFTGHFYSASEKIIRNFGIIANDKEKNTVDLESTKSIRFNNWRTSDNYLAANYIFLKVSYPTTDSNQDISQIWLDVFRLNMVNIFGESTFDQGQYALKNYAAINVPITRDSGNGEVYTSVVGIAYDKEHVTLYTYKEDIIFSTGNSSRYNAFPLFSTGKYSVQYDSSNYDTIGVTNPNIGFLSLWRERQLITNRTIRKFDIVNDENDNTSSLGLSLNGDFMQSDDVVDNLETISFTKSEFEYLQSLQIGTFPEHPNFIRCSEIRKSEGQTYILSEITLTLGVPTVVQDEDLGVLYVGLENSPIPIEYNGDQIIFTSIDYH